MFFLNQQKKNGVHLQFSSFFKIYEYDLTLEIEDGMK
jgi:hypothetical protein